MNIFVLDSDLRLCAEYHSDRHVIKMILESAQMLCTVLHMHGIEAPYKPTHMHHPCTLWAGESLDNWKWLRALARELNEEYKYRFDAAEDHRSAVVARDLPIPPLPEKGLTDFAQAMPEEYRIPGDAVGAYRQFYNGEKIHLGTWTKRTIPDWFVRR